MNVFFLDYNPKLAALYHCDAHCVKMILETGQILSTAHRFLDVEVDPILYKMTHVNHPSVIWARSSENNYYWLYRLMIELNNQWRLRWGHDRDHKTIEKLADLLSIAPKNIPKSGMWTPPQCMPDECRGPDTVAAYRKYYMTEKRHIATWTKIDQPDWFL